MAAQSGRPERAKLIEQVRDLLTDMPFLQAEHADDGASVRRVRTIHATVARAYAHLSPEDAAAVPVGEALLLLSNWIISWEKRVQASSHRPYHLFQEYEILVRRLGVKGNQLGSMLR